MRLQLIKGGTSKASKKLLGLGMADRLALALEVLVVSLEGLVGRSTGNCLVRQRALVLVAGIGHLLVLLAKEIRQTPEKMTRQISAALQKHSDSCVLVSVWLTFLFS